MAVRFQFSDGWLLTTLWAVGDSCDRAKLNQVGDLFNHAVFTDEEVEGGMRRLEAAGFAEMDGDRFRATEAGKAFVNGVKARGEMGHIKMMLTVARELEHRGV